MMRVLNICSKRFLKRKLRLPKTIYVTGITGFIGSNLLSYLLKSFDQVVNFTRDEYIQIIDREKLKEIKFSNKFIIDNPSNFLINLATLYQPYPKTFNDLEKLVDANILFPARVINNFNCIENFKIINAVSYHQLLEFNEQNIYSLSKELFKKFIDNQTFEIVNIYIFDTFGAGDSRNKVTDIFIKNVLSGQPITIPKNEININLSDNESVSNSLVKSISLSPGSYSLMSPDTVSLEYLALKIMNISKKEVKLIKKNIGKNYFNDIKVFPKNIYSPHANSSLDETLSKRIFEIKESLNAI